MNWLQWQTKLFGNEPQNFLFILVSFGQSSPNKKPRNRKDFEDLTEMSLFTQWASESAKQ